MPQVTSAEPQKRKKDRFNIFLDGKYAFSLDTELFVKHRIRSGQILSQKNIDALLKESETSKLIDLALNFLSFRPRSQKEVEDYLTKKISQRENIKFAQAKESNLISDAILKLKKYKYINDIEFAKWWVASRGKSRPKGKLFVKIELLKKGVSKELIDEVLQKAGNQTNLALRAVEKKLKNWQNLSRLEFKNKVYRYLVSRGFDFDEINKVVAELQKKR